MQLSDPGEKHLFIDEGNKTIPYKDVRGIWTVGPGFTEIDGRPVTAQDVLTPEKIKELFPKILKPYEDAINTAVTTKLYQHEFDALVCFCYNVGVQGFKDSAVVKALNKGNKQLATLYFFNWRKPVEIIGRRYNDALLFTTGEYLQQ